MARRNSLRNGGSFDIDIQSARTPEIELTPFLGIQIQHQAAFEHTRRQAARTGYAPYDPSLGLRDVSAFVSLKTDLGAQVVLMGALSLSRVVGAAAASPLVVRATGLGVTTGLGYRF